jgi:dihydrofolate reductase
MSLPTLCLIVAAAENGVIGHKGKMPWHLPFELKYFRARTLGKPVIMGRKTFQSIGKALPGRANIVVTRDGTFGAPGITSAPSLVAAIGHARAAAAVSGATEIMVIGGGEIYAQALPIAARVYLTRVALSPEGDATFPALSPALWRLVSQEPIPAGGPTEPSATACIYDRIVPEG